MSEFRFTVEVGVSVSTVVEAASLEEAIRIAKERAVESIHSQGEDAVEWVTSGEIDGDPSVGKLVNVEIDDDYLDDRQAAFSSISAQWAADEVTP